MPNTLLPTQIGYTPASDANLSQVIIGRDITLNFEAIGLGKTGRPDTLQNLVINISSSDSGTTQAKLATITISADDILTLIGTSDTATAAALTLKLREVTVCEDTDGDGIADKESKMMILASKTY